MRSGAMLTKKLVNIRFVFTLLGTRDKSWIVEDIQIGSLSH